MDLLETIKNRMSEFSKGQRYIAEYILEHYDEAAYMNAARLGAVADVSESTVVRFAMMLGYKGYPEFLKDLNEVVKSRLTSVQRVGVTKTVIGDDDVLSRVLSLDAESVRKTVGNISQADFKRAVREIVNAENIYIIGMRSAQGLAEFLYTYLSMMFKNVFQFNGPSASEMFERIHKIGKNDVLIAISFPRYSSRTINACRFAKSRGARVISLTDSERSPLIEYSDCKLLARCEVISFIDSLVAPLSILNALIVAVGLERQDDLRNTLTELEQIWDEYDVYAKDKEDEND